MLEKLGSRSKQATISPKGFLLDLLWGYISRRKPLETLYYHRKTMSYLYRLAACIDPAVLFRRIKDRGRKRPWSVGVAVLVVGHIENKKGEKSNKYVSVYY